MTGPGTNTYIGTTLIDAGTLTVSGGNAIADTSQVTLANVAGATLNLANNETIGNLSGGGTTGGNVTLGTNTLTVNEAGAKFLLQPRDMRRNIGLHGVERSGRSGKSAVIDDGQEGRELTNIHHK